MKKLLAVGVVALGTLGLLLMRSTKTAVAAPQAPSRELAPLQLIQRIPVPAVAGRIDHFTAFPKRRLLIFAALATIGQGRSERQRVERTSRRTLRSRTRQDLCSQRGKRHGQSI